MSPRGALAMLCHAPRARILCQKIPRGRHARASPRAHVQILPESSPSSALSLALPSLSPSSPVTALLIMSPPWSTSSCHRARPSHRPAPRCPRAGAAFETRWASSHRPPQSWPQEFCHASWPICACDAFCQPSFLGLPGASWTSWGFLEGLLAPPGPSWGLLGRDSLGPSGDSWGLLGTPGVS